MKVVIPDKNDVAFNYILTTKQVIKFVVYIVLLIYIRSLQLYVKMLRNLFSCDLRSHFLLFFIFIFVGINYFMSRIGIGGPVIDVANKTDRCMRKRT